MFLLSCDKDKSWCPVANDNVIYDPSIPPEVGDEVRFIWDGKTHRGSVLMYSDNIVDISERIKELKKGGRKKLRVQEKRNSTGDKTMNTKRMRIAKHVWSPSDPPKPSILKEVVRGQVKKDKNDAKEIRDTGDKATQSTVKSLIAKKNVIEVDEYTQRNEPSSSALQSPTKKDLKKMMEKLMKENQELLLREVPRSQAKKRVIQRVNSDEESSPTSSEDETRDTPLSPKKNVDIEKINKKQMSDDESYQMPLKNISNFFDEEENIEKNAGENINNEEDNNLSDGENNVAKEDKEKVKSRKTIVTENRDRQDEEIDDFDEEQQLIGQHHTEKMTEIAKGVYCIKRKLTMALSSGEATAMARHLIDGIFKKENLVRVTLTGRPPHAQGEARLNEIVYPLHKKAKDVIIDFSLKYAKKEGWKKSVKNGESVEYSKADILKTMTQKIGDIKRLVKKNAALKNQ